MVRGAEHVILVKAMGMVEVLNMVAEQEEGAVVLPTLTTPMMKNRVVPVFLAQVEAAAAVLERAVLVKI